MCVYFLLCHCLMQTRRHSSTHSPPPPSRIYAPARDTSKQPLSLSLYFSFFRRGRKKRKASRQLYAAETDTEEKSKKDNSSNNGKKKMRHTLAIVALAVVVLIGSLRMVPSVEAIAMTSALNGPLFLWTEIENSLVAPADAAFLVAAQDDFQTALASVGTVTVSATLLNDTAFYLLSDVIPTSASTTAQDIEAVLLASPLPALTSTLDILRTGALADISGVFPEEVRVIIPLPLPPAGYTPPSTTNPPTATLRSEETVLISGNPEVWRAALERGNTTLLVETICAAAVVAVTAINAETVCTGTVGVLNADPKRTSMGNGEGGLLARLQLVQSIFANAAHGFDADEMSSLLREMNCTTLEPFYTVGSTTTVTYNRAAGIPLSVVTVTSASLSAPYRCTNACKGMIVLGAIAAAIMVVTVVTVILVVCGCLCCGPCARFKKQAPQEEEEPNRTEPINEGRVSTNEDCAPLSDPTLDANQTHSTAPYAVEIPNDPDTLVHRNEQKQL